MLINRETLVGVFLNLKTTFQKAFDAAPTQWEKTAMLVPSGSSQNNYDWLDRFPRMRKWIAEYQQAGSDANAFKASGYSGSVPITVSCWAQANPGWTNQQAADDIIATAAKWMTALQNIRSARLLGKSSVNAAATVDAAQAAAATAIQNVQQVAAGV
jgi:hypothetical protein